MPTAPFTSRRDQRLGRAIEEVVAVMVDDRVEEPGLDVLHLHRNGTAGHAEMPDDPFLAEALQHLDWAAGRHRRLERGPFLIVQVHDFDAVDAEQAQRALHAPLDGLP